MQTFVLEVAFNSILIHKEKSLKIKTILFVSAVSKIRQSIILLGVLCRLALVLPAFPRI